ncbi:hypothetical protein H4R34_001862 [Dimargaris verticillata]|uniref:GH16 domain-containing protein n=1 Tax=Dimargaris verticillata TaxID=2761393 RepID=A0A9W8E9V4_9FUNG|nr:hypothetical protein H4R34_001862 [Dimargaris verticillata]
MQPFVRKWALTALATVLVPVVLAQPTSPARAAPTAASQALTKPVTYDFSKTTDLSDFEKQWGADNIKVKDGLLQISMDQNITAPTIVYSKEIKAGKIDIMMKAAGGPGVATAFMMYETKGSTRDAEGKAYPYDEIDIEIVGKAPKGVQSMFFSKGSPSPSQLFSKDTTLSVNTHEKFIHYGIELTNNYVKWYINEREVHTYKKSQGHFPQDAKFFRIGVWAALNHASWAGQIDFSKQPFIAQVQSIAITPYPSGRPTGKPTVATNTNGQTTANGGSQGSTITTTTVPLHTKLWNAFKGLVSTQVNKLSGPIKNMLPVQFTGL